jgi:release factor glutamine methyltransferase
MTVRALLTGAAARLAAAGVETPALDARLLLGEALGVSSAGLILAGEDAAGPQERARFEAMLRRRAAREPVSRILGRREFYGRPFRIAPAVLDPRPDTETLVEVALALAGAMAPPVRMLDLGTGSGAILLTLLAELPDATGTGVDIDEAALDVARANATALGLEARARLLRSDWTSAVTGPFDLVVSNPPYVAAADIDALAPEVAAHEPRLALDGGPDGLAAYRAIAAAAPRLLRPGGALAVEIGAGQAEAVAALFAGCGLEDPASHTDLAGRPRVFVARTAASTRNCEKALGNAGRSG